MCCIVNKAVSEYVCDPSNTVLSVKLWCTFYTLVPGSEVVQSLTSLGAATKLRCAMFLWAGRQLALQLPPTAGSAAATRHATLTLKNANMT